MNIRVNSKKKTVSEEDLKQIRAFVDKHIKKEDIIKAAKLAAEDQNKMSKKVTVDMADKFKQWRDNQ